MVKKSLFTKLKEKITTDNERGARQSLLEELFYDLHRNRKQIYTMNFIRGIFFGLGSVLGGTVIVALLVWILSFFVQIPGIGSPIEQVQQSIQSGKNQ